MPITNPHELSVVELFTSAMAGPVNLAGLEDLNAPPNTDVRGGATAGTAFSEHESVAGQQPEITFTSMASIKSCLDHIGLLGKVLTAGTNVGLAAYLVQREHGSTYASGASHRRYRIGEGIIVPTTLRANFRDDSRLGYQAVATYDGLNDPVQAEDGVSIPTNPAPVRDERYTLYSISAGGVPFNGAQSVELNFGVSVIRPEGATGDSKELVWPTFASINRVEPTITISGLDPKWVSATNIPLLGKRAQHADSTLKLIRRLDGSTFHPINTANHITITTAGLISVDQLVTASDKENGTVSVRITSRFDGVNAPLLIDTGVEL